MYSHNSQPGNPAPTVTQVKLLLHAKANSSWPGLQIVILPEQHNEAVLLGTHGLARLLQSAHAILNVTVQNGLQDIDRQILLLFADVCFVCVGHVDAVVKQTIGNSVQNGNRIKSCLVVEVGSIKTV
jgi:hypothetical protein